MSRLFVGVDIGSSATKGILVDESGQVLASSRREHAISSPRPGWAEMDAERDWWCSARDTIGRLLQQAQIDRSRIAGMGICGIGASFVPIGERGEVLRPAILYGIDSRASTIVEALRRDFDDRFLLNATGRLPSSQSVGPKLQWLRQHEPQVWQRTRQVLSPTAFVTQRLCGASGLDYHTALSFDPLLDAGRLEWNEGMCERLIGQQSKLPQVLASGACVGTVHAQAALETGLPPGVPVACGTADVVAEAIGAGVSEPGDTLVMYGSTLFMVERVASFQAVPPLWPSVFMAQDQPTLLAGTSNAGSLLAWFRREFASSDSQFGELLLLASAIPPGADGLLCLPYFAGERAPVFDPLARGVFLGLTGRHTKAHMLRALIEGICLSFRHLVQTFSASGNCPQRFLAGGGGIQIDLWAQTMSDVVQAPQQVPVHAHGAAFGAAYLGAQAAGIAPVGAPLPPAWGKGKRTVTPQAARGSYDDLYAAYLESYELTRSLVHRLARPSV